MAKRFYSDFKNYRNETYTIEVWDTDFIGTATLFDTLDDGFSISYKGNNQERTGTVLATECSVAFRVVTADHETFLTDIIASKEGRFTLKITKGTGTPTLFWVGLIITDIGGYEEAYRPFFTLRAVDGLGLLKDKQYKDGANFYTGKATLKDHLVNALTHIEFVSTHFAATERFLRIGVDWWEETMTNNTTNDPLALTWVDHATWYIFKKDVQEALSCYEVIDNILRCFGARITMHEGVFWVEQITYRTASTIVLRSYDVTGAYLSSNNFSDQNAINQTAAGALEAVGVYEFFAPLSEARHTFNVGLRQNHLAGQSFSSGVITNVTINKPIEANSGATTLRLTGNISLSLNNQTYSGNVTIPRFALFKCTLKIGTYYLKRTYTVQNYQVIFGAMTWETTASNFYLAVSMPNGVPTSGNTYNYSQVQDITTPPLPVGSSSFQFGMIWELITQADIVNFLVSFNFLNQWLEPYSYGHPALNDDAWEYKTLNPDVENTLIHETECLIGNSTDPNAVGALWVKPSSAYVLADDWGDGADTPDRDIEKLNIELVLGGQQHPIRRLSGNLRAATVLLGRVTWDGAVWLLLGGTFNAGKAEFSGEWFELDYDGAGLSTSGPIRYKRQGIPGLPDHPNYPGTSGTSGKAAYELPAAGPGTLLYPVAATKSLDALTAGAITNIDITDVLAAGDFYDGDTIVILNPITGAFDELEVTVTSAGGDDFITVTGTLTTDYPPDSPIIKKPLIGHPQVFGSGTANRLAYWVSANELSALAAGTDGWPLVSNGASLAAYEQLTTTGIADDAVTFAKMQNIASGKLLGRYSVGSGDVQEITVSTGLILDGSGNLTATSGGTNYQTLLDDGVAAMQRPNANFVSGSVISFTLTDDAGNTETEITAGVVTNSISNSLFRQSAGLSVVGRSANTTGDVADITAGTDGHVLRRNGAVLGFGQIILSNTNTVSGALQIGNGGTGLIALGTANQLLRVDATASFLEYFTPTYLTANQTITLSGDVTGSGSTAITTTIASNAVTDAKFRQSAGLSVVGRSANTTGNVADITAASDFQVLRRSGTSVGFGSVNLASTNAVTGTLPVGNGGTGAATLANDSVLTGNGTSAIVAETNLTFNSSGQLTIGSGTPAGLLNVFGGALSSATEMIRMSANISNNMIMTHLNANNATTAANSIYQISVGGGSAGDPLIQFSVSGVGQTAIGVDNSDADKFKITPGASVPGGTANRGMIVTNAATALVGVNRDAPTVPLDVAGSARAQVYHGENGSPSVSFGTGAGTGPANNGLSGGSVFLDFTFTTGTSPAANGTIFTITLPFSLPIGACPTWSPGNAQTATDIAKFYRASGSTTTFVMQANGTLAASTQYRMFFHILTSS